jgi:hypothetical protein
MIVSFHLSNITCSKVLTILSGLQSILPEKGDRTKVDVCLVRVLKAEFQRKQIRFYRISGWLGDNS